MTSLANALGGVILYGVSTVRDSRGGDTGVPDALTGLSGVSRDREILRLESMLRDGVDPPLTSQVRMQFVEINDGDPVLVIGAFRSFSGPHQVTYAGTQRFWIRGHTGKYQPEVGELRQLFLGTASWLRQAEEFRMTRLQRVRVFPQLDTASITLVHVLPLAPVDELIDLAAHQNTLNGCRPLESDGGWSWRFNADGFMTYSASHDPVRIHGYTQWFRIGGVEGFSSGFVGKREFSPVKVLWLTQLRRAVIEWVTDNVGVLQTTLRIEPPFAILLSLQGVVDAQVPTGRALSAGHTIDWDELILPPVLFDPARDSLSTALKPMFDTLAQSSGLARAPE